MLCSLFIVLSINVKGQTNHYFTKISGIIADQSNRPVSYATVELISTNDTTIKKAGLSGEDGTFTFDQVKPGRYRINVSNIGFLSAKGNEFQVVDSIVSLTVDKIVLHTNEHSLKTVTISASKPTIEVTADKMTMNVENSVLAAGSNALEILGRVPGVTIDQDNNISLKGQEGVNVMINGRPTNLTGAQLAAMLKSTDGSGLKSIEVLSNSSAKFDASGGAGIINIILKRNKQAGTYATVTAGAQYAKYWGDNFSTNISHNEGKLNTYLTLSHSDSKGYRDVNINRQVNDSLSRTTFFRDNYQGTYTPHPTDYLVGADYQLTKNNNIGFEVSGFTESFNENGFDINRISSKPLIEDSLLTTQSRASYPNNNLNLDLNDKLSIDTSGQQISVNLDYSKFNSSTNSGYINDYFLPDGSIQDPEQNLQIQTTTVITIHAAKLDYVKPIGKTLTLESGFKISEVNTTNAQNTAQQENGTSINDATNNSYFSYDEKIKAGYASLNEKLGHITIQAGLRSEYTQSNSVLIGSPEVNRHYLDFFPNASVKDMIDDNNSLTLSYSKRIDRPNYAYLNPFVSFLNPYTEAQGNSFLNPQYVNKLEAGYTLYSKFNVSIGYSHTSDAIQHLFINSGDISILTFRNINVLNYYDVNLNAPITINKWWSGNINFTGYYREIKSDTLAGNNIQAGKASFIVKASQTFLVQHFKAEISGDYSSQHLTGISIYLPQYGVDAGVSRSFDNNKVNIKFAVNDIFNSRSVRYNSDLLVNNDYSFEKRNDSRVSRLTFTYRIGNSKKAGHQNSNSGADEERNRAN